MKTRTFKIRQWFAPWSVFVLLIWAMFLTRRSLTIRFVVTHDDGTRETRSFGNRDAVGAMATLDYLGSGGFTVSEIECLAEPSEP